MKLIELRHPFFRPRWRRVAVTVVCLGWSVVEFSGDNTFWGMLFGAIGLLCLYEFFIVYDEANYTEPDKEDDP
ncbi:hypothetical protein [Roseisalinus antarcticus]|uniref:DUF3329 domain-containing protein n=1 Tax=Roseisalinus antarcticus TaxID=254357 RepID=A0A1Y5SER5_9RHOB|nr:hypothetical protein [Roseisalinus antarcticus]SLN39101.1 hypothetical protein ROA7023_01495 [Roseisalinus antarcticus]